MTDLSNITAQYGTAGHVNKLFERGQEHFWMQVCCVSWSSKRISRFVSLDAEVANETLQRLGQGLISERFIMICTTWIVRLLDGLVRHAYHSFQITKRESCPNLSVFRRASAMAEGIRTEETSVFSIFAAKIDYPTTDLFVIYIHRVSGVCGWRILRCPWPSLALPVAGVRQLSEDELLLASIDDMISYQHT